MKYNTVSSLCEGVAGAIRRKEGSTEKINPQDFVQRIDNLQVGGGTEDLSDWEYYDCSSSTENVSFYAAYLSARCKKAYVRDGVISKVEIGCLLFVFASSDYDKYIAIAVDFSQPCIDANGTRTLREQITLYPNSELAQIVGMLQSLPRITKEQFYSLE